jgi:murein DD-endopeptidase MepM/ murein hydrolase activator NlpD
MTMRVGVEFKWEEVGWVARSDGRLQLPLVPMEPGIYCFRVFTDAGMEVYIGESQNLRHRMLRNYASKHRGRTNVRVRQLLLQRLDEGRRVQLAVARRVSLRVEGEQSPADLRLKHVRLLVENAALVLAQRDGHLIRNL